jgi:hypothetical protein
MEIEAQDALLPPQVASNDVSTASQLRRLTTARSNERKFQLPSTDSDAVAALPAPLYNHGAIGFKFEQEVAPTVSACLIYRFTSLAAYKRKACAPHSRQQATYRTFFLDHQ